MQSFAVAAGGMWSCAVVGAGGGGIKSFAIAVGGIWS